MIILFFYMIKFGIIIFPFEKITLASETKHIFKFMQEALEEAKEEAKEALKETKEEIALNKTKLEELERIGENRDLKINLISEKVLGSDEKIVLVNYTIYGSTKKNIIAVTNNISKREIRNKITSVADTFETLDEKWGFFCNNSEMTEHQKLRDIQRDGVPFSFSFRPILTGGDDLLQLFIKSATGRTTLVFCRRSYTVNVLKNIIFDKDGVGSMDFMLVFGGVILEPRRKLGDYKLQEFSTIQYLFSLRGGKPVILFYPTKKIENVKVAVSAKKECNVEFLTQVTHPNKRSVLHHNKNKLIEWNDLTVEKGGKINSSWRYLYYEFEFSEKDIKNKIPVNRISIVEKKRIGKFLDIYLSSELNSFERQDFITHWERIILDEIMNDYVVVYLLPQEEYEKLVNLEVNVKFERKRVFVLFWGIDEPEGVVGSKKESDFEEKTCVRNASENLLVEWGGSCLSYSHEHMKKHMVSSKRRREKDDVELYEKKIVKV